MSRRTHWSRADWTDIAAYPTGFAADGVDAARHGSSEPWIRAEVGLVLTGDDDRMVIEGSADDLLELLDRARAAVLAAANRPLTPWPKIEVLNVHHEDAAPVTEVWVDGVRAEAGVTVVDVDPGRGHVLSDWRATANAIADDEALSPGFRQSAADAYALAEDSEFISDDTED